MGKTTAIIHAAESQIVVGYVLQYKTGPYLFLCKHDDSC